MNKEEILKKLRIYSTKKMLIINAPNEYLEVLSGIDFDTESNGEGICDFVQVFGYQQNELKKIFNRLKNQVNIIARFGIIIQKEWAK